MKILLCLFAATLLCGCKPDPKMAKLEAQVADLHAQIELLKTDAAFLDMQISNCIKLSVEVEYECTNAIAVNFNPMMIDPSTGLPNTLGETIYRVDTLSDTVSNLIVYINASRSSARFVSRPAPVNNGQPPSDVVVQIRASAQHLWPNDYEMQVYEINKQVEAWRKLNQ